MYCTSVTSICTHFTAMYYVLSSTAYIVFVLTYKKYNEGGMGTKPKILTAQKPYYHHIVYVQLLLYELARKVFCVLSYAVLCSCYLTSAQGSYSVLYCTVLCNC